MKQIQWFPGHMTRATRQLKEKLKLVDIIFELVDARIPESSGNPHLREITSNKPKIFLLNKMDKADDKITNMWIKYYEAKGHFAMKLDSNKGLNLDKIGDLAKDALKEKIERDKRRGLKTRKIRAMIIGIPNVGKSTIINKLSNKKVAKTGDTPGVTKAQQWIRLKDFELLDTPGILWPKFEDNRIAFNLAVTGAIRDAILPLDDVAIYGLKYLDEHYKGLIEKRYDMNEVDFDDLEGLYDKIGRRRGALIKGNTVDYEKVSKLILKDIRDVNFGRASFEKPSDLIEE